MVDEKVIGAPGDTARPDWWTPGCFEAAPGVHRIPLAMPNDGLRAVNVYAIETSDGLVLIDGGWHVPGTASRAAMLALRSIGRELEDVSAVFVTHIHRDHYTLAVELRRQIGARVHLGRAERLASELCGSWAATCRSPRCASCARAGAADLAVGRRAHRTEPFDAADWEDPDGWLDAGPLDLGSRQLEVVPTPGHTKGHVVFHDVESGLMFTGDHVLPTITPSIGFELGDWGRPLADYLDSLGLMMSRPDAMMMPAHGHPGGSRPRPRDRCSWRTMTNVSDEILSTWRRRQHR